MPGTCGGLEYVSGGGGLGGGAKTLEEDSLMTLKVMNLQGPGISEGRSTRVAGWLVTVGPSEERKSGRRAARKERGGSRI